MNVVVAAISLRAKKEPSISHVRRRFSHDAKNLRVPLSHVRRDRSLQKYFRTCEDFTAR